MPERPLADGAGSKEDADTPVIDIEPAMPELDASSMKVFGRMLRVMKHLGKMRAQALEPFGFRDGEFDVLATLRRAGAQMGIVGRQKRVTREFEDRGAYFGHGG